jgi:hypothetical protein
MQGVKMAEVVLFHHAQGLTPGVAAFAAELRRAGDAVHTPDLFEGRTFDTVEDGVSHAEGLGFGQVIERVQAVEGPRQTILSKKVAHVTGLGCHAADGPWSVMVWVSAEPCRAVAFAARPASGGDRHAE